MVCWGVSVVAGTNSADLRDAVVGSREVEDSVNIHVRVSLVICG